MQTVEAENQPDRIVAALRGLDECEQLLFVGALDRHAAGDCTMEEALADFVSEVLKKRGSVVN